MTNLGKIAKIFPECITESRDDNGNLKRAINFDALKEILIDYLKEVGIKEIDTGRIIKK